MNCLICNREFENIPEGITLKHKFGKRLIQLANKEVHEFRTGKLRYPKKSEPQQKMIVLPPPAKPAPIETPEPVVELVEPEIEPEDYKWTTPKSSPMKHAFERARIGDSNEQN